MTRRDPLLPFVRAARSAGEVPLSAAARDEIWRAVETRHRRALARRRAVLGAAGALLAVAAALVLVLSRPAPSPTPPPPRPIAQAPVRAPAPRAAPVAPTEDAVVSALGPDARYVVARTPSEDRVEVTLSAGGVRCDVAHRESRRFVVAADGVRIVDRGTRFDVTLLDHFVAVRVDEGSVEVTAGAQTATLRAGEQGRFARATSPARQPRSAPVDVAAILAAADAAMERSDLPRAESLLRLVTRQHRAHPRAQAAAVRLGRLLREQGRVDDAVRAFEDARAIAPRGALVESAWSQEVSTLAAAGRGDEARAVARRHEDERRERLTARPVGGDGPRP